MKNFFHVGFLKKNLMIANNNQAHTSVYNASPKLKGIQRVSMRNKDETTG
jgi:hypothetical protein